MNIYSKSNVCSKFQCHCTARYKGKNCEIDTGPPCRSDPCHNSGRCIEDNKGDYVCSCPPGFTGTYCETEISAHPLCENDPCLNDGICKVIPGTSEIECDCAKGYSGNRCEVSYLLFLLFIFYLSAYIYNNLEL